MKLNELIMISEGLMFFKDSKRIRKLIEKLKMKIATGLSSADPTAVAEVKRFIAENEKLYSQLVSLEARYESGDKTAIQDYKDLRIKAAHIYKKMNADDATSAFNISMRVLGTGLLFNTLFRLFTGSDLPFFPGGIHKQKLQESPEALDNVKINVGKQQNILCNRCKKVFSGWSAFSEHAKSCKK